MAKNEAKIKVIAETDQAQKELKELGAAGKKVGEEIKKSFTISDAMKNITAAFGKIAAAALDAGQKMKAAMTAGHIDNTALNIEREIVNKRLEGVSALVTQHSEYSKLLADLEKIGAGEPLFKSTSNQNPISPMK